MSSWLECTMTLTTAGTSFRKMFKPLAIQFQSRSGKLWWKKQLAMWDKVKIKRWGSQKDIDLLIKESFNNGDRKSSLLERLEWWTLLNGSISFQFFSRFKWKMKQSLVIIYINSRQHTGVRSLWKLSLISKTQLILFISLESIKNNPYFRWTELNPNC